MKGKRLKPEEVINLPYGAKVWIENIFGKNGYLGTKSECKKFVFTNEQCKNNWKVGELMIYYEWIEDEKAKIYKGSEIIHMIEEGMLKNDDIISDNKGNEIIIRDFENTFNLTTLLVLQPFIIKERKLVDFMTAVNSDKNIRPISLKDEKRFHPYTYWIGFMSSNMDSNKGREPKNPLDLINGLWEIEY